MINNHTIMTISWHLAFKCTYWYIGIRVFNNVVRSMPMLHNDLQVKWSVHKGDLTLVCSIISSSCIVKCESMTLAINILNNIFPCMLKCKNYHLKCIPVCYADFHEVSKLSSKKWLLYTNNIILAICGSDTFRPLGI
jgi:hypothetical protein